jgi:superfamily II DNA or RNA helicase
MKQATLSGVDLADLADAVGGASYARGIAYFHQHAVGRMWWDGGQSALVGTVRGRTGEFYTTTAFFMLVEGLPPMFEDGRCSCPVGVNCKHVVALVLAGTDTGTEPALAPGRPSPPGPSWERSLDALLGSGPAAASGQPGEIPLAVELTLAPAGRPGQVGEQAARVQPLKLTGRLVQPGKNGSWINGSLSWNKLDSLRYQGYLTAQLQLLQEMYAMHHPRGSQWAYNGYGPEKYLDLSAFESAQLWQLLDQAESTGLRLLYGRKLGVLEKYGAAELCLDVTCRESSGSLQVTPLIRVGEASTGVRPLAFIGSQAHGLVYVDAAEARRGGDYTGWRFRLARLAKTVPRQLQEMALAGQQLQVPAAEQSRFRDEYYPRLRHTAAVISSDGTFAPPEISGPALVLSASYGDSHDVDTSWAWAYQVGDAQVRAPLRPDPADGYRDLDAERLLLAGLDLPLGRFGLLCHSAAAGPEPALAASARLAGIDTMRFTTELLPLLAGQPGVSVEISGDPADYRAADDTLRIEVSTDEVAGETDWFDLGVTISAEGHQVPFTDVFLALSRGETHLLLDDGAYFSLQKPELQALAALIEEARGLVDAAPDGALRISRFQAGLWDELTEIGVVTRQAQAWEQQVQGLLSIGTLGCADPPPAVRALLRPYQLDGFRWLAFLWEHRLGGILADDMGLGKTLQTLALISRARQADPDLPPFLIVAPTSVVPNWAAESARFTPELTVVPVTATTARSRRPLDEVTAGADVVVTSYALLRIDFDRYSQLGWSGLILDEAQFAKNHQSKIYQCARRLPAPFKLAITGTPMENNLMELWSLLSITAPGLFPNPVRFRDYYARPIEAGGQAELLGQLRRRIKPLVKRRTKELVAADLPAKQEQVLELELHPRHRKLYQTHLQRERQKVLGLIHDMNANRFTIFRSLTLLRQLSLHAGLVDDTQAELPCAKIDALLDQLRDVTGGGHRALVFSQFTGFLRIVAERLDNEGISYCYLDGKTRDRAAVLQDFSEGSAPVFLISLKAGGFGLNLTEADYCFLLDPWWNPATEAQAVDRIHRIGQTRNVMVYRLIAKDTIEEKVMALKERKAELFSSVIDSGNAFGAALSADDIRGLFA